jgi:hypothetical protein
MVEFSSIHWLNFLRSLGAVFVTELIIFVEASCAALRHVSYNSSPACQRRFVHRPRLIPPGSPNALALLRSLLASDALFGAAPWRAQSRTKQFAWDPAPKQIQIKRPPFSHSDVMRDS